MSCDRKFWCHAHAKAKASAGHAHTTKALAVPPALAAMGYEPANGGWQLRPGKSFLHVGWPSPKTGILLKTWARSFGADVLSFLDGPDARNFY